MVETAEFERDLLGRLVQNIKPSKAAIFSGPNWRMAASHGIEIDQTELNLSLVQKVIKTKGPVSDKVHKRQLAAPYKDAEGNVLGVMYVEIAAPRRLKFRDLAILQGLGRQLVERYRPQSSDAVKEISAEAMGDVTRFARSTFSIVSSVLKPQRLLILVRLQGTPTIVASKGFDDTKELSALPFSLDMVNAAWEKGETCHISDALNDPAYSKFAGVTEHNIRSVCICPLNKLDGEDRGLIYLDSCKDASEFLTAEVSILKRLALALEKDLAKVLGPDSEDISGNVLGSSGSSTLDNDNEYALPDVGLPPAPKESLDSSQSQSDEESPPTTELVSQTQTQDHPQELAEREVAETEPDVPAEAEEHIDTEVTDIAQPEMAVVKAVADLADPNIGLVETTSEFEDSQKGEDSQGIEFYTAESTRLEQTDGTESQDEDEDPTMPAMGEVKAVAELRAPTLQETGEVEFRFEVEEAEPELTIGESEVDDTFEPEKIAEVEEEDSATDMDFEESEAVEEFKEFEVEETEVAEEPEEVDEADDEEPVEAEVEVEVEVEEVEPEISAEGDDAEYETDEPEEVEDPVEFEVVETDLSEAEEPAEAEESEVEIAEVEEIDDEEPVEVEVEVEEVEPEISAGGDDAEYETDEPEEIEDPVELEVVETDLSEAEEPAEAEESEVDIAEVEEIDDEEPVEVEVEVEEVEPEISAGGDDAEYETDEPEEVEDPVELEVVETDLSEAEEPAEAEESEVDIAEVEEIDDEEPVEVEVEVEVEEVEPEISAEGDDTEYETDEPEEAVINEESSSPASTSATAELEDDSDVVTITAPREDESEDDCEAIEPTVEETAPALKKPVDDEVEAVRSLPVDSTLEVSADIAARALAGVLQAAEARAKEESVAPEPEVEPEPEHEEDQEPEADAELDDGPEVESELETEFKEEPEVEPELDAGPEVESELETESEEEPEHEEELEPEVKSDLETESQAESQEEPQVEPELDAEPEPEKKPEPQKPAATDDTVDAGSRMQHIEKGLRSVAPAKKATFWERLKWVFLPKAVPNGGGDFSHVHISGAVVLQGGWNGDEPIEVVLKFPTHNLRVILELGKNESEYSYHGRFEGQCPIYFELMVEKPGYSPVKLSKITFVTGDGEPSAQVTEITLIPKTR